MASQEENKKLTDVEKFKLIDFYRENLTYGLLIKEFQELRNC